MYTLSADYMISKRTKISVEMALSNYDVNLFSSIGKENDVGYAMHTGFVNSSPLKHNDTTGWISTTSLNYEYVQKNFTPIERYRPVEFTRDWNVTSTDTADENIATFQTGLSNKKYGNVTYELGSYTKGDLYNGLHNQLNTNLTWDKFHLLTSGSYLTTDDQQSQSKTQYYKHMEDLSKTFGRFTLGVRDEEEHDEFLKAGTDSLYGNSFAYKAYTGYIGYIDSSKNSFRVDFKQRTRLCDRSTSDSGRNPGTTL